MKGTKELDKNSNKFVKFSSVGLFGIMFGGKVKISSSGIKAFNKYTIINPKMVKNKIKESPQVMKPIVLKIGKSGLIFLQSAHIPKVTAHTARHQIISNKKPTTNTA